MDVFNHINMEFWSAMMPAFNLMGFISCAGTNFVISVAALQEIGEVPHLARVYRLGRGGGAHKRWTVTDTRSTEECNGVAFCTQVLVLWLFRAFQ